MGGICPGLASSLNNTKSAGKSLLDMPEHNAVAAPMLRPADVQLWRRLRDDRMDVERVAAAASAPEDVEAATKLPDASPSLARVARPPRGRMRKAAMSAESARYNIYE